MTHLNHNSSQTATQAATLTTADYVAGIAHAARDASVPLRTLSSGIKNAALEAMAAALRTRQPEILAANELDVAAGAAKGLSAPLLGRLTLSEKKVEAMALGCLAVAALPDPVGRVISGENRPNGLSVQLVRVPLGVVGVIYESRPNVTVDCAILALKAGNAVILRGGSEAIHTNKVLTQIICEAAVSAGVPANAIQIIQSTDREASSALARQTGLVDLIVPRGGEGLKKALTAVATVPVIFAAGGTCHVYVDAGADIEMAAAIAVNAKINNPSACNAAETLLVHREVAARFLPVAGGMLVQNGVELRGDAASRAIFSDMLEATEEDWGAEYLDLILAVKIVDSLDEAVSHIARYGTAHSEAIVTGDVGNAEKFLREVDAAAVYVNASTRFTDGYEFGLGAEVGISTQKLHVRGPLGLEALTTTKYIVRGDGQIR